MGAAFVTSKCVVSLGEVEPVSTAGPDRNLHQSIFGMEPIIPVASGPHLTKDIIRRCLGGE